MPKAEVRRHEASYSNTHLVGFMNRPAWDLLIPKEVAGRAVG